MHALQVFLANTEYTVSYYSGRGMFGKQCLAVTDVSNLGTFIADVYAAATDCKYCDDVFNALRQMKTDSLGMGMVVYFPNVTFEKVDNVV